MASGSSMQVTDEELSAFLDGELPAEALKRIAAALDEDESLRRRLQRLAFADHALAQAYAAIGDTRMPSWVTALISGDGPAREERQLSRHAAPLIAAAALTVGVALGYLLAAPKGTSDAVLAGVVSPASALNAALETSPSGADIAIFGGKTAALETTFRGGGGAWCREFIVTTATNVADAIACRRDEKWIVEFAAAAPTSAAGKGAAYRRALATLDPGTPLSAPEEEALLRAGWPETLP